jgi:hypothetical protein
LDTGEGTVEEGGEEEEEEELREERAGVAAEGAEGGLEDGKG